MYDRSRSSSVGKSFFCEVEDDVEVVWLKLKFGEKDVEGCRSLLNFVGVVFSLMIFTLLLAMLKFTDLLAEATAGLLLKTPILLVFGALLGLLPLNVSAGLLKLKLALVFKLL